VSAIKSTFKDVSISLNMTKDNKKNYGTIMSQRNVTMTRKFSKNHEECAGIRKKIDDYNKYQWLVFIPLWGVTIAQMIFPARTLPMPEIYILFLDVAAFLFSVIAFIAIRLRVGKLRYALAQLEKTDYIPKHSQPSQRKR